MLTRGSCAVRRSRAPWVLALVCLLAGCQTGGPGISPATSATGPVGEIDHVVLGSRDLARGMEECRKLTGIAPIAGGVYPDLGVADGLLSIGTHTFLEVLAPDPNGRATALAYQPLHSYSRLTPFGWAVGVADLEALRARLLAQGVRTSDPESGRRELPDGTRLEWRSMRIVEPAERLLPSFIEWDALSAHPAATSPTGCRLQELVLETPSPDRLRATLELLQLGVEVIQAPLPRLVVRLSCATREIEIR